MINPFAAELRTDRLRFLNLWNTTALRMTLGMCLLLWLATGASTDETKPDRTTAELVGDLKPSIVVISFSGRDGKQEGLGTGFVVSEDGLIATNFHVIGEGRPISVQFADGTKRDVIAAVRAVVTPTRAG